MQKCKPDANGRDWRNRIFRLLLNSDRNLQDMPSLLVAQATTAVEECDATEV